MSILLVNVSRVERSHSQVRFDEVRKYELDAKPAGCTAKVLTSILLLDFINTKMGGWSFYNFDP